jgi:putative transcriptional regulator
MKTKRKDMAKQIGAEMIAGMEQLLATMETSGKKAVMEKHGIPPPPGVALKVPTAGKKEVKAARQALGVSQPVFALILGASVQAVRAWEQGTKPPSGVARRLIGEIRHDPAYWRKRFGLGEPVNT